MSDIMKIFRDKFESYRRISDEQGHDKAIETLMIGYAERQKKGLGPFIKNNSLFEGFSKAIPVYAQYGMKMTAVDISNNDQDGVLEVHRICPFMDMAKEYGLDRPCTVICDLDIKATLEAFDGIKGGAISRVVDGDCVCIFKYERAINN